MPRTRTPATAKRPYAAKRRPKASRCPPSPTFEQFLRLPPEIRQQIWKLVLPTAGAGVCMLPTRIPPSGQVKRIVKNPYSAVRQVCRESRALTPPKSRPFNPETDILYLRGPEFKAFCAQCREKRWPAQIRHLAISLPLADADHWFHVTDGISQSLLPLRYLKNLDTVSVVYPHPTGTVDYHEEATVSSHGGQILQQLTNTEMTTLKVHAEYWPERDYKEVWTKTARLHLSHFKATLSAHARAEEAPCWDDQLRRLSLTVDARCFVVNTGL